MPSEHRICGRRPYTARASALAPGLFLLFCLTLNAAPAKFRVRCVSVKGTNHVFLDDVARYYGMTLERGPKQTVLRSRYSRLLFTRNRRESVLNNVKVNLSFAPTTWKNQPLLSEPDFRLLLDPILRPRALPKAQLRRIMLDPGHGGGDNGASGKKRREKNVTLSIAQRLAKALQKHGYVVAMTRERDTTVGLSQRAAAAKRGRADILVSIHANFVGTRSVKGVETFLLSPRGTASTYGTKPSAAACTGNRFDKQNARLAYEIQKGTVAAVKAVDRGVKHARFLVLKDAPCAAVLIETGFLSNLEEERLLGSPSHQAKLVAGMVNGIRRYHDSLANKR